MRSYRQYCALAKALDLIGDRWTLLIVRELLIRGSCRYTDLRNGLPGIATNLLAERLRELERAGILLRDTEPPPVATDLYRLTPRGAELEPVVHELGRWGRPLLAKRNKQDTFRSHWLALPAKGLLNDRMPDGPRVTIEVRTGDEPLTIEIVGGDVHTRSGSAKHPDLVLTGEPHLIVGVLAGRLAFDHACAAGLKYDGDPSILRRVQPQAFAR
jgi:DNA-binding HxlR family transcriptional regulator